MSKRGPVTIDVSEAATAEQILGQLPQAYQRKALIAGFRKGASPMRSAIKRSIPAYLKPVVQKAIKVKAGKSKDFPNLAVGVFGRTGKYTNSQGQTLDPYMILYWHNYGTLSNRDPNHRFVRRRRAKTVDYMGGIKPLRFVDKAIHGTVSKAQDKVEQEWEATFEKFLNKYKV